MVQMWRCKICGRVAPREEWGTYKGSLSCSTCLAAAYVDTLELVEGDVEPACPCCGHRMGCYCVEYPHDKPECPGRVE